MRLFLTTQVWYRHIGPLLAKGRRGGDFRVGPYGRMMAEEPSASVVVENFSTTVMVVDMLRAVPGVVLVITEIAKGEKSEWRQC